MFVIDLILTVGSLGLLYGAFWAGAKYQTLAKFGEAIKAKFSA